MKYTFPNEDIFWLGINRNLEQIFGTSVIFNRFGIVK